MSVISIVQQAYKIYRIANRFAKRTTRGGPGYRFAEHFPPNIRPYARDVYRGSEIAFSGGLIAESLEYFSDALQEKPKPQTGKLRKTRSGMEQFGSKRSKSRYQYRNYKRCRPSKRQSFY